jgi:hypothetical protein
MLGWHVSVYRQTDGGASPAAFESPEGTRVAVWQAGIGGLDWLIDLVKAGKAINLGGDGYPVRFTATAEVLNPRVVDHTPPGARTQWLREASDFVTDQWEGKTVVDGDAAAQMPSRRMAARRGVGRELSKKTGVRRQESEARTE